MSKNEQCHAYLIMAHNNVAQLNKLLQALDDKRNDIYLHIDAKSAICKEDLVSLQNSRLFLTPRMHVYWADYSQVECELLLLKEAVTAHHSYYHLLSGSDLPLKSQEYIYRYFDGDDRIYLHYTTKEKTTETIRFVKYYHLFQKQLSVANRGKQFSIYKVINKLSLGIQKILGISRISKEATIKKGANWFSIPHDFANYVISQEHYIQKQFAKTRSPDEFFLQTLAFNSNYKDRIYRFQEDDGYASCLRLIDWKRGNPYVFRKSDYDELITSDMLFARKFDSKVDDNIIDELCEYIQGNSRSKENV